MFCQRCGEENSDKAIQCLKCGEYFSKQPPQQPYQQQPAYPQYPPQQPYQPNQQYPPQQPYQQHPPYPQYSPQAQYNMWGAPPKPNNYVVFSIICVVCCCLPGGVIALYNSSQVDTKYKAGDYFGAQQASDNAKLWCILSLIIGGIAQVGLMLFRIAYEF